VIKPVSFDCFVCVGINLLPQNNGCDMVADVATLIWVMVIVLLPPTNPTNNQQ